jgi:Ca-activated chloride channel family protein
MTKTLPILTDEEVHRCLPADEEAGFGALATDKGFLPLKAMDVQARIDGLLAQTTLCQTFVNALGEPLEATYIFPLPDRAAVTHFRMEVAGRVIEGVLKEREEARQDFEQAIQSGRRAAITEEERPGVFTLRVDNLMPGEEATVRLTMTGPLVYSDGEATFRFPLVVAPRYIPGTPLPGPSVGDGVAPDTDAVPDASRISPPVLLPGFPNPVRLSLAVEVHAAGMPVDDFRSSLHAIAVSNGEGSRRITLQPGERLNRDFILRFRVGEQTVQTALAVQPDADGKEGTFLLTIVPPTGQSQAVRPRDIVFVLDRSGSMGGWKMVAARRALARMVDTLTDRDRFTVYAFDDTIETASSFGGIALVQARDRNRYRAVEFLARIEARGGTEMAQPLQQAVLQLAGKDAERERILVLVTDGQVGNEDQILRGLAQRVQDLRVFTLGIDQAVNAAFLQRLACLGGGSCELVESEDRLDEVMAKVHRRIGAPVLTGLRLEPAGLEVDSPTVVPGRLPDLFAGAPLLILGRYRGGARGSITVKAQDAAGRLWSEAVQASSSASAAISSVWARGQVRELEDRYVTGRGDHDRLEKQIVQTSLQFGVLCRFTAFVAVDVKEVVNPSGQVHRVTQPVEAASGWAMLGTDREEALRETVGYRGAMPAGFASSVRSVMRALRRDASMDMGDPMCAMTPGPGDTGMFAALPPQALPPAGQVPAASSGSGPASGSRKRAGIRGKLGGLFGRRHEPSKSPPPLPPERIDLTAYRRRAMDLLKRLHSAQGSSAANRLTALGVLAVQLAALVEDLQTIGVPVAEVRPLEDLLNELRGLLAGKGAGESSIAQLWTRVEEVLQEFCQGHGTGAAPAGKRRKGFWK